MAIKVYENSVKAVLEEVERIFKENRCSQGIHISINMDIYAITTIDYEVKSKFVGVGD